jgi:hypothetical protein
MAKTATGLKKLTSQSFLKTEEVLEIYEDEFIRIIHEKQNSKVSPDFEVEYINIYKRLSVNDTFTLL